MVSQPPCNGYELHTVLLGAGGVFRLGWHRWGTALLMVQSGSRALAPEEEPEEDDGSRVFRVAVTRSDDTW